MSIADEKYVLLTTTRNNGATVPTPVWIVALPDGTAGFTTEAASGKVKRIRNNPAVTLQACSVRGKVRAGAPVVAATAEVLEGPAAHAVGDAVRAKYRVVTSLLKVASLARKVLRRPQPAECAVKLTLG
ncbi:MAG: PPOX class F420-dependent oxidoreductase [Actinomycetota bacterium]|nr:PPOX class F420-dependent oxidoreductase [Actinomycetota bacterium]